MTHTPSADPDAAPASAATQGPDQTDRVIIAAAEEAGIGCPCDVIVVDDATGELTACALDALAGHEEATVLSWTSSRALADSLRARFPAAITAGRLRVPAGPEPLPLETAAAEVEAHLVLMRLPKALQALEDRVRGLVAAARATGRDDLALIAGGRVKHMTRRQNDVLATVFEEVRASRGIGKSRALIGSTLRESGPVPAISEGTARIAVRGRQRELPLRGSGAVFGGAAPDAGSLLLLRALDAAVVAGELAVGHEGPVAEGSAAAADGPSGETGPARRAVDLGCGNGLLTAYLAAVFPDTSVLGSDIDADAVASTRATLAVAGLDRDDVAVTWDDGLSQEPGASADLVLLNPPFHDGTVVDATLVQGMLDAAARVLRPGGQLWFVHNSHLRYRPELAARIGPVHQRARDPRFTVLSATKA